MDLLNTDGTPYTEPRQALLVQPDGSVATGADGTQYGAVIVRIGKRDVILGTYQFAPGAITAPGTDLVRRVLLDDTQAVSLPALAQALVETAIQVDGRIQARAETADGALIYGTLPVAPEQPDRFHGAPFALSADDPERPELPSERARRLLGEAVGAASTAWGGTPTGTFDEAYARSIVDYLADYFQIDGSNGGPVVPGSMVSTPKPKRSKS